MPDERTDTPPQPQPAGIFIQGGRRGDDGRHYGGQVVNAHGQILAEYGPDEVNPGTPRPEKAKDKDRDKAADDPPAPVPKPDAEPDPAPKPSPDPKPKRS